MNRHQISDSNRDAMDDRQRKHPHKIALVGLILQVLTCGLLTGSILLEAVYVRVGFISIGCTFIGFCLISALLLVHLLISVLRHRRNRISRAGYLAAIGILPMLVVSTLLSAKVSEDLSYFGPSYRFRLAATAYDSYIRWRWTRAEYRSLSSDRVTILAPEKANQEQLDAADSCLAKLESITGLQQLAKIIMVRQQGVFDSGAAIIGIVFGSQADEFRNVDRHELAHAFINQHIYFGCAPPQALSEGFASHFESKDFAYRCRELLNYCDRYGPIDVAQFLGEPPANQLNEQAYCLGGPLVDFLVSEFGAKRFAQVYIRCSPNTIQAVFEETFDVQMNELVDRFWGYVAATASPASQVAEGDETLEIEVLNRLYEQYAGKHPLTVLRQKKIERSPESKQFAYFPYDRLEFVRYENGWLCTTVSGELKRSVGIIENQPFSFRLSKTNQVLKTEFESYSDTAMKKEAYDHAVRMTYVLGLFAPVDYVSGRNGFEAVQCIAKAGTVHLTGRLLNGDMFRFELDERTLLSRSVRFSRAFDESHVEQLSIDFDFDQSADSLRRIHLGIPGSGEEAELIVSPISQPDAVDFDHIGKTPDNKISDRFFLPRVLDGVACGLFGLFVLAFWRSCAANRKQASGALDESEM